MIISDAKWAYWGKVGSKATDIGYGGVAEPRRVSATWLYALIQIFLTPQPDRPTLQVHFRDRRCWWRLLRHIEQAFLDEFVVFGCDGPGFSRLLLVRVLPEPDGNIVWVDFWRFRVENGSHWVKRTALGSIWDGRFGAYLKIGRLCSIPWLLFEYGWWGRPGNDIPRSNHISWAVLRQLWWPSVQKRRLVQLAA